MYKIISLDYTAPVSAQIPARKAGKELTRIGHANIIPIMQFLTGLLRITQSRYNKLSLTRIIHRGILSNTSYQLLYIHHFIFFVEFSFSISVTKYSTLRLISDISEVLDISGLSPLVTNYITGDWGWLPVIGNTKPVRFTLLTLYFG